MGQVSFVETDFPFSKMPQFFQAITISLYVCVNFAGGGVTL